MTAFPDSTPEARRAGWNTAPVGTGSVDLGGFFSQNPVPMWIYDPDTLRILEVNEAAVARYGHARAEFLEMTLDGLRSAEDIPPFHDLLSRELTAEVARSGVSRHVTKSGEPLYVEVVGFAIRYQSRPARVVMCVDVTDRVIAEQEREASDVKFAAAFAASPTMMALLCPQTGRVVDVNESFLERLGLERGDVVGHLVDEVGHGLAQEDRQRLVDTVVRGERVRDRELPFRCRGGEHRVGRFSAERVGLPDGPLVLIQADDVTPQKRMEAALRESEERFRTVVEQAADALVLHDADGTIWSLNAEARRQLGYAENELIGESVVRLVVGVDPDRVIGERLAALAPGESLQLEALHRRKDGSVFPVETRACWLQAGEDRLVLAASRDITQRRHTERALRDSERRYREFVNNAPVGVYRTSPEGRVLFVNSTLARLVGYQDPEQMEGRSLADVDLAADYDRDAFRAELERHGEIHGLEATWRRRDGTVFHGRENCRAVRDPDTGEVLYYDGTIEDVTERVEAERARQETEASYQQLVERATYGILRSAPDGRILSANPALVRMLGYADEADVLALRLHEDVYVDPADRDRLIEEIEHRNTVADLEVPWRRRDGETLTVRVTGWVLRDAAGRPEAFEYIVDDVTQRRALEMQLRHSQKMEAVGQLTGGIAHDFNNILTVVLANADLLAAHLERREPELYGDVRELQRAARRGAEMIRKLLAFSRNEQLSFASVQLNTLLQDAGRMLGRLLPETITVRLDTPPMPPVHVDSGAVEQILMNLATNARDAMPGGGTLAVSTSRTMLSGEFRRARGWGRDGAYVRVEVTDTGCGMDERTVSRLFEPFFTTKPVGRGTGLGMAMIYGLMKQHGGYVDVTSVPDKGTTVALYFPTLEETPDVVPAGAANEATAPPRGTERILLVEDEEVLRRSADRLLRSFGYEVVVAEHGEAALEVLAAEGDRVDLVVSDVVMPRIGGPELIEAIRGRGLDTRVLLMSGYAARDIPDRDAAARSIPFLRKPWTLSELAHTVREVLDA